MQASLSADDTGLGGSAVTATITINAVVDIAADSLTTAEDSPITANVVTGTNGASADTFENAGRAITSVTQGLHGSVSFLGDGSVTYTPDADYHGTDSFDYTVTSGGVTETTTVSVNVTPVVDVADDSLSGNEATAIVANVITGTNGASADGFSGPATITSTTQGLHGSVSFLANGTVTYTPVADYYGPDSFTYTVMPAVRRRRERLP